MKSTATLFDKTYAINSQTFTIIICELIIKSKKLQLCVEAF